MVLNEHPRTFETKSDWLRFHFGELADGAARLLARLGLWPNTVTIIGVILAVIAGWFASQGALVRAGVVLLVAGCFDALDGALARVSKRVTRFGAFWDSMLDRYGEGFLLAGLGYWLAESGHTLELMLVFATLIGSLLVSYARARADGIGLNIRTGLLQRPERFVVMLLTFFSGQLTIGLAVMAVLTNFTVAQRMLKAFQLTRDDPIS